MIVSALLAATVLLADTTPAAASAATAATAPAPAARPAPANTVSPATVTAATPPANKPRVICKTEAVTGSLMPKKTCYTTDDYAQRQQDERQNLQRIQNNLGLNSR